MSNASKAVNGLERAKEIISANMKSNPKTRRLVLANITSAQKVIEDLEERIAIMSESDDTGEELPFLYDDTPDEPCEEDEYV